MNKALSNVLFGFIAGAAVGTLAGILVAPDKGDVTRKKIAKKVKSVSKDVSATLSDKVDKLKEQVNGMISDMKGKKAKEEKVAAETN